MPGKDGTMAYKKNLSPEEIKQRAEQKKEQIKSALKDIEENVPLVFTSDRYQGFLDVMSRFHNYSVNNTMLISIQNPGATHVASFRSWRDDFERTVNKGEKAIRILAPSFKNVTKRQSRLDQNGDVILNENGEPETEEKAIRIISKFVLVPVFDISQTSGKELPVLTEELTGDSPEARHLLEAVEKVCPITIHYKSPQEDRVLGEAYGYYDLSDNTITVNRDLSNDQKAKTLIHEFAHSVLHKGDLAEDKDRSTKEIEAESTAYVVCRHFGLDTSDYSFTYVAGWAGGKKPEELKAILGSIQESTGKIITELESEVDKVREREFIKPDDILIVNDDFEF